MNRLLTLAAAAALATLGASAPALASGWAASSESALRTAYSRVDAVLDGAVARTTVTQVFVNDLDTPVEVTYRFPLPADASVTGFADWRDGRRLEATVAGKEDARDAYEDAAAAGLPAALAEKEGDARFAMRLSTVPARGARRVELTYVQTLPALGGERTFVFPAEAASGVAPATVLDLDVTVRADRPIHTFAALNHPDARVSVARDGSRHVTLSRSGGGLAYDFALRWRVASAPLDLAARAVRPVVGQPGYVEAAFSFASDPYAALRPPQDVVLLLDRSLSMAGEPLERGRALVEGILAELAPEDRFTLLTFNDRVDAPLGGLVPADDAALDLAQLALDEVRASGRSDLQRALDAAARVLRDSDAGTLVLVTDGQPTLGAGYTKVPLAVDPADFADHRVVLAHVSYPSRSATFEALFTQLTARYVPDGDAGAAAVEDLIRLVVAPVIEDFSLSLDGPAVFAVEGKVPARLAVGESVRVLARAEDDVRVTLSGLLHGRPVRLSQRVALPKGPDARGDRGLPVEWARQRVAGLEARLDAADADAPALEAEIRSLGAAYRLATRFTSYVLTDGLAPDRIKPGDPEIRIHAPETALGVRAILPWGEEVSCAWQPEERLWLGRFLVPRGTPDGLYRIRVFVDDQAETTLRGTLFFRVDSRPPEFELTVEGDAIVRSGGTARLVARPKDGVYEGRALATRGDVVVRDRVDLKRIVVRVGEREIPLVQDGDGERWIAEVPIDLAAGRHLLRLVAVDYALNSTEATLTLDVQEATP